MIAEVREEIYRVGSNVFEHFFFLEAAHGQDATYAVFTPFALPTSRDTGKQYEDIYFQYALFTNDLGAGEITKQQLDAAFKDPSSYQFESYQIVGLYQLAHLLPRLNLGLWQIGAQFKLEIEPKI